MFTHITADNAPVAYNEALWRLRPQYKLDNSRNGPVRKFPGPVLLEVRHPQERVLFDPIRDANPFFHIMEAVWMLAGENKVDFLLRYNKRMDEWAQDGVLRGAYGHRWRRHFSFDQIGRLIQQLKDDPETRQAVLAMWDAKYDNPRHASKDRPCNTHIYFELRDGYLDMYVMNRSNDLIWGMLGANIVHMTILHELIAHSIDAAIGTYYVFSKNTHIYEYVPRFEEIWKSTALYNPYLDKVYNFPILSEGEQFDDLMYACQQFVKNPRLTGVTWIDEVVLPMHQVWEGYKKDGITKTHRIMATDWRLAVEEWLKRRDDGKVQHNKGGGSG